MTGCSFSKLRVILKKLENVIRGRVLIDINSIYIHAHIAVRSCSFFGNALGGWVGSEACVQIVGEGRIIHDVVCIAGVEAASGVLKNAVCSGPVSSKREINDNFHKVGITPDHILRGVCQFVVCNKNWVPKRSWNWRRAERPSRR